jgi:FkbM family methyltransferase
LEKDLIYDVGLHNGDDTAYYLSEGYRVVGIEADPTLVQQARFRFSREIKQQRLTLLNIGIGPKEGMKQFWVCEAVREWNSFDKVVASRMGMKNYPIDVYCRPFGDVLQEHGVPYYLKIDIEHHDHYCVEALDPADPPRYVSSEFTSVEDLIALRHVGYNAFKIIHQSPRFGFSQFHTMSEKLRESSSNGPSDVSGDHPSDQIRTTGDTERILPGPSGPFGAKTGGQWSNFEETAYDLLSFMLGHSQHGKPPDWFIWFDIHATNQDVCAVRPLYD